MANEFRVKNGIFSPNIGTESGDFTIDSAADIIIDADGADIILKDNGTAFGSFKRASSDFIIKAEDADNDIIFKGIDGSSVISALTLDMSAAGAATFNDMITAVGTSVFTNLDISGNVDIDGTTNLDAVDIDGNVQLDGSLIVGVDDTGYDITFFGATAGAYMMWDASADDLILAGAAGLTVNGNVGIGTTSPVSKVHIEKTAYDFDSSPEDGDYHLMLKASESSTAGDALSIGFAQSTDGTTVGAKISHLVTGSYSRGHLVFSTNNTASGGDTTAERMRITNAGDVGIGTTSPGTALDVSGSVTLTGLVLDGNTITGIDDSGEFTDNDAHIMTSAAINDKFGVIAGSSSITTVGTIGTGTWQGTAIASAYLDSDTAHLSGTQTFSGTKTFSSTLLVAGEIQHSGDTNNSIAFGTDTQTYETGGSTRFDISDSGFRIGGTGARVTTIENNDSLGTSDTKLCTQGNVKAYVDSATSNSLPSDPNADRLLIWDDSAGAAVWATAGNNLTISGTDVYAATTGASVDDIWDVANIGHNGDLNSWIWNNQGSASTSGTLGSGADAPLACIAMGTGALAALTEGDYNYGIGHGALNKVTTAPNNVAMGAISLYSITTDGYNTGMGYYAGYLTLGIGNTYVGASTGSAVSNATGDYNIGIGYDAVDLLTSGNKNICIGYQAGDNITTGSNNVIIGNVDSASGSGDDNLRIGSGAGDVTWISGDSSGNLTMPAEIAAVSLDISGDIDVDGTANLDNTDIDGTLDVSGIVSIASEIRHTGDTNNSIAFGTDTQTFETGGTTRLDISNSGVRFGATGVRITSIENNDSLGTSDTKLCTQGNVKAYVDANIGGGGLSNIVEDTSPELGGDLDTNSMNIKFDDAHGIYDDSGNEMLIFGKTTSATSYIKLWNSIADSTSGTLFGTDVVGSNTTGGGRMTGPGIEATGSETDIGLAFKTKGLGHFVFVNEDSSSAGAPAMNLFRKNAGEADNDTIGVILFTGHDSSPASTEDVEDARTYGKIRTEAIDVSDGSADGCIIFSTIIGDSHTDLMEVGTHSDDDDASGVALMRAQIIDKTGTTNALSGVTDAGRYIMCGSGSSACTVQLQASPGIGEQYVFISNTTGTVTIEANGSDTINGSTNDVTITTKYNALTLIALSTSAWVAIG